MPLIPALKMERQADLLNVKPTWTTQKVPGQQELLRKTLPSKKWSNLNSFKNTVFSTVYSSIKLIPPRPYGKISSVSYLWHHDCCPYTLPQPHLHLWLWPLWLSGQQEPVWRVAAFLASGHLVWCKKSPLAHFLERVRQKTDSKQKSGPFCVSRLAFFNDTKENKGACGEVKRATVW